MDYCAPRGIPHSIFLGRVPEPGEPQWLPEDRDKAIAWAMREKLKCGTCGVPATDFLEAHGGHEKAYRAEWTRCPGCEQLDKLDGTLRKGEHTGGLRKRLVPNFLKK